MQRELSIVVVITHISIARASIKNQLGGGGQPTKLLTNYRVQAILVAAGCQCGQRPDICSPSESERQLAVGR
jgi:hypothetical protein